MWDTAGQERFRALTTSLFRGTQILILVYDVCKVESFTFAKVRLSEIKLDMDESTR